MMAGEQLARFDISATGKSGQTVEVSITISPVREGEGRIVGASVIARDISERNAADRHAALLLGELDHRVKNILTIVSAVVAQTLALKLPPAEFAAEVDGRIKAIANAHSLLTQTRHGTVSLRDVIDTELAPYRSAADNIAIDGTVVDLPPRAGMALALAIHELTSNAVKYGALSTPAGRLAVTWSTHDDGAGAVLTFDWTETGGPPVITPTRRGFGTTLIERALEYELDAVVIRAFTPGGVRCTVTLPLTQEAGHTLAAVDA
jgi:two-component system CheB/CheR fusion protein